VHLVHAIEVWRGEVGPHIADWLRAVGEFEALACLAGFSYERPEQPFPEILDAGTRFEASGIGHPLIPRSQCVSNDVGLDEQTRLILISGSNMSGKSTMLRTIGTNLVLAQAGTTVRAQRLNTSVFQIGTAMRIHDSLQSGESLFYAAVSRLKSVVDLSSRGRPLLFLFDEILQGTNSHDRLIGSEGVIRALVTRGAIGLVTTHDLALTELVNRLDSHAINFHFEDSLIDGKMTFDYRIRSGVVQKSNALEIMRLMGLNV
jgi:DNA mismatch repair ATPase MutS